MEQQTKKEICLFWVDGESESVKAQEILDKYNISYSKIDVRNFISTDVDPPRLTCALGRFQGLEQIIEYTKIYSGEYTSKDEN